jgi:hypothetical protein
MAGRRSSWEDEGIADAALGVWRPRCCWRRSAAGRGCCLGALARVDHCTALSRVCRHALVAVWPCDDGRGGRRVSASDGGPGPFAALSWCGGEFRGRHRVIPSDAMLQCFRGVAGRRRGLGKNKNFPVARPSDGCPGSVVALLWCWGIARGESVMPYGASVSISCSTSVRLLGAFQIFSELT